MNSPKLQPRLVRDLEALPDGCLAELAGLVAAIEAAGKEPSSHV